MLTLTQIKIQESADLRAINEAKGITSELLTSDRLLVSDEVHTAVRDVMRSALGDYLDKMTDPANYEGADGVDFDAIRTSLEDNINSFKIDSGTGFTNTHKASILGTVVGTDEEGNEVVVEAIDFVKPANRGGASTDNKPAAKGGSFAL